MSGNDPEEDSDREPSPAPKVADKPVPRKGKRDAVDNAPAEPVRGASGGERGGRGGRRGGFTGSEDGGSLDAVLHQPFYIWLTWDQFDYSLP